MSNTLTVRGRFLDAFVCAYLECAFWAAPEMDNRREDAIMKETSIHDLPDVTIAQAVKDCDAFRKEAGALLDEAGDDEMNGRDFLFTRNGHGVGFWDRGYGDVGRTLSDIAEKFGTADLYVGDDGLVYFGG